MLSLRVFGVPASPGRLAMQHPGFRIERSEVTDTVGSVWPFRQSYNPDRHTHVYHFRVEASLIYKAQDDGGLDLGFGV